MLFCFEKLTAEMKMSRVPVQKNWQGLNEVHCFRLGQGTFLIPRNSRIIQPFPLDSMFTLKQCENGFMHLSFLDQPRAQAEVQV